MDLFGLNRFFSAPDRAQKESKGPARFFRTFWDNLGGLLAGNLLTFAGFLPLALGVSLGLVYENAWITLLAGCLGGALAGVFWTPMLSLSVQALRGGTQGWFRRWRSGLARALPASAAAGAVLGLLGGGLLGVGGFASGLLAQGDRSPLPVWVIMALDLLLLSLAAALAFPALCAGDPSPRAALEMLLRDPLRTLAASVGLLAWGLLLVGLFPVSVPFATVLGFWPPALLCAQLMLPMLEDAFDLSACIGEEEKHSASASLAPGQRGEIFWRRRWPVVVILTVVFGLLLWGGADLLIRREPDVQIAVVRAQPLPDSVRTALEASLAALVGDRNGDGKALAQVNDYTMTFDGSAADADMQTAGSTLLVTDIAAGVSTLYLVEDPQGFLARYGDKVSGEHSALWKACPSLAALDAGTYTVLEDMASDLSGQELLAPLAVLPGRNAEDKLLEILLPENLE